jgi:diguanylate cyclase (GGDEF)-like protein/PAS domain S-box-containing protein
MSAPPMDPILIVEDDAGTAILVKAALAEAGWDSAVVTTGGAAITWLASHSASLMLLDNTLPDMTGEELVRQQAQALPPFIVTTGSGSEKLAVALMKRGARDYLVKSSDYPHSLQPAVARVLHSLEIEEKLARAEVALRESEIRYRRITEGLTDFQYSVRVEQGRAVATTFGLGCESVTGYSVEDFSAELQLPTNMIAPQDRVAASARMESILEGHECAPMEYRILRKDGTPRWVRDTAILNLEASGALLSYDGVIQDITERKVSEGLLQAAALYSRTLIEAGLDPMLTISAEGKITDVNTAAEAITGVCRDELIGADFGVHFTEPELARTAYLRAFALGRLVDYPLAIRHSSGTITEVLHSASVYCDESGSVLGVLAVLHDITERKDWEGQLLRLARYDTLTQLPNRKLFLEAASMGIAHATRNGMLCAVLFVDLDAFKSVNDALGHSVGDDLLVDTADRLSSCIRETDMVARFGGDEFVILLNDLDNGQGARVIAERVLATLGLSRIVSRNDLFVTASVGIAVYPHDGASVEDLLKNADAAMYAAKSSGKNRYCFYDDVMNRRAASRLHLERGLRNALAKGEFVLFYQPIINVPDGTVKGCEALLRWASPEGELILPDTFIHIAEAAGTIVPIGEWVLREACSFNKRLVDAGYVDMVMSVNISVAQLRHASLVETIQGALAHSGLRPELLELEVTESLCIESFSAAAEILDAIRAIGVRVCLDDFGTGYSSLVHLQKLPITTVKIDRQFIKELTAESVERSLVPAIITMAHQLKLRVVAEGVETALQLEVLAGNGCDYFQGYLFSRPIPGDEMIRFLQGDDAMGGAA